MSKEAFPNIVTCQSLVGTDFVHCLHVMKQTMYMIVALILCGTTCPNSGNDRYLCAVRKDSNPRDTERLIAVLKQLRNLGNTVVVEHNPDVISAADWVIDLGPEAGADGGNIVFCGTPEALRSCPESQTGKYI